MTLSEMIQQAKEQGIGSVHLKMRGKSKPVLEFLDLMDSTEPFDEYESVATRAILMANDMTTNQHKRYFISFN